MGFNLSFIKKVPFSLRSVSYITKENILTPREISMKYLGFYDTPASGAFSVFKMGANSKRIWYLIGLSFIPTPICCCLSVKYSLLSFQFSGSLILVSLHYANPHLAEFVAY